MSANIIPHPLSGEVIELDATTDVLAEHIEALKELRRMISDTIDTLSGELTERLDAENTRSAEVGEWRIEGKAPFVVEYDPEQLLATLKELEGQGLLAGAVIGRTVSIPPPKDWKVDRREVNKLLRHADARVREAVQACGEERPQKRSITVRRAA